MLIIQFHIGYLWKLSQAFDERLFDAVNGSVGLARSFQVDPYNSIFNHCLTISVKTIRLNHQTVLSLGLPGAFEIFIQHSADRTDIGAVIAQDACLIRWRTADHFPAICEVDRQFQPERRARWRRCVGGYRG